MVEETQRQAAGESRTSLALRFLKEFLRPVGDFVPILVALLFFGALFWAKWQDPFSRKWFSVKATDGASVKCVAVLPKPIRNCPVIIYAHDSGGTLMFDGNPLRQMAEMGLVTVSLEYNQTNEAVFDSQLQALLNQVNHQGWANTNAIAWVGFGQGADWLLNFANQHPTEQPRLLVQLSGSGLLESSTNAAAKFIHCPVLFIHSDQVEQTPLANARRSVESLQTNGVAAELKVISGVPHDIDPEQGVLFRAIGEYCLTHLNGKDDGHRTSAWQNYHSIAQWQAEAPPFWRFCLPAAGWLLGGIWWKRRRRPRPEKLKLTRGEIILRWVAAIMATWALSETALHLLPPYFSVSDQTLSIARRIIVAPRQLADFATLARQPIWSGQKLKTLLTHVELANYNRELINWQLDETNYDQYVLSPVITGETNERFNWRRPLWEEFYPRIRHENSPADAARIVVRHLRERVTIANIPDAPHDIPTIWRRQITDEAGFEIIYVAALRSVGVPARLNSNHRAEFYDGTQWQPAPAPLVWTL